ncbi:MAG: ERF family protein [Baekduiaceae bacterium]
MTTKKDTAAEPAAEEEHHHEPDYTTPELVPVQEALRRVMLDVGAIGKNKEMKEGPRYNYRSIDDILAAAQPSMIRHGVIVAPTQVVTEYEMRSTSRGNAQQWVSMKVDWIVKGPMGDTYRDEEGRIPTTAAEALDTSDKATNKVHTATYKTLLAQLLSIPYSADDQDASRNELGTPGKALTPEEQAKADRESVAAIAAAWEGASFDQTDKADELQKALDALTKDDEEIAAKVLERTEAKAYGGKDQKLPVVKIRDLDPGWLNWWEGLIIKAREALAKQEAGA